MKFDLWWYLDTYVSLTPSAVNGLARMYFIRKRRFCSAGRWSPLLVGRRLQCVRVELAVRLERVQDEFAVVVHSVVCSGKCCIARNNSYSNSIYSCH